MRPTSSSPALLIASIAVLGGLLTPPAHAQTSTDGSLQRLERAEGRLESAGAGAGRARTALDAAFVNLENGMQAFLAANRDLEEAGLAVAAAREAVSGAENALRASRVDAQANVVAAYMAGPGPNIIDGFDDTRVQRAAVERVVRAAVRERLDAAETTLAANREALAEQRRTLDDLQAAERERQLEAAAAVANLEVALHRAAAASASADRELTTAGLDHAAALAQYQTEIKKRAALLGVERWRSLVEAYFPRERVNEALAVMACESRGDPDATNPFSSAAGLFQFLDGTWPGAAAAAGFPDADRYDPEANIAAAAWLVQHSVRTGHPEGPWGHWACREAAALW